MFRRSRRIRRSLKADDDTKKMQTAGRALQAIGREVNKIKRVHKTINDPKLEDAFDDLEANIDDAILEYTRAWKRYRSG